ncbi:recombinase family protein [Nocardiopsis alba]|uniref:recombinase family protein n=1 Tax=Nocardiopsis alba TaxID=53437 RepID=UPI003D73EC4C
MPVAIIYLRLSRDAEDSTSIESQRRECVEWCERRGWRVLFIAEDVDVSGATRLEDRDGMAQVLERLAEADYVVAAKLDRYARSVLEFSRLLNASESSNATLITTDGTLSPETSKLVVHVLSAFAEYERDLITARIRTSRNTLRRQGRWLGGAAPYGYRIVERDGGKYLEEDPVSATILRKLISRILDDGATVNSLVHELNEAGTLSPADYARSARGRETKKTRWTNTLLRDMLLSQTLRGYLMHDPRPDHEKKDANGKRVKPLPRDLRPVLDEHGDPVCVGPELVDSPTWHALQEAVGARQRDDDHRATDTLLLHVAECSECTGPLYYNSRRTKKQGRMDYYSCPNGRGSNRHAAVNISAEKLENLVRNKVLMLLGSMEIQREEITSGADRSAEIRDTEESMDNLSGSLASLKPGSRAAQIVTKQLEALEAKLEKLEAENAMPRSSKFVGTGSTFADEWERRDTVGRRSLLQSVGTSVTVTPARKEVGRKWDPSRVRVDVEGPVYWRDRPDLAALEDVAFQEAS